MQKGAKIHPVKLVATENQIKFDRLLQEIAQVLAHRVRRPLIPLRPFRSLLGRQNVHKTARKMVEFVARLNMAMQRHAVKLRQDIDRAQSRVQAVADRDVDDPILATDRYRRLGAVFGQWKQACPRPATHNDGQGPLRRAGRERGRRHRARRVRCRCLACRPAFRFHQIKLTQIVPAPINLFAHS